MLRILKNEKYIGVLKQKKGITVDYLSHKRKRNEGEEDFIIVENSHTPIVSKEIFDRTQNEIVRRRTATFEKSRYSNRHVWSGKVKCAYCTSSFKRKINNCKSASPQIIWQCSEAERYGRAKINANGKKVGCDCKIIHEQALRDNFLAVLNLVIENKDQVILELKDRIRQAINDCPNKSTELKEVMAGLEKIAVKKSKIIDMYVDGLIKRLEFEKTFSQYEKQQDVLQKQLSALDSENKIAYDLQQRLDNVDRTVESLVRLKEFGDSICSEVLHKVVVEGRDKMSFYLASAENKDPVFFKIPLSVPQYLPV